MVRRPPYRATEFSWQCCAEAVAMRCSELFRSALRRANSAAAHRGGLPHWFGSLRRRAWRNCRPRGRFIPHATGEERILARHGRQNARFAIEQRLADRASQEKTHRHARCDCHAGRSTLECGRRQSHHGRGHSWGRCEVFDRGAMQKSEYRRFNVRRRPAERRLCGHARDVLSRRCTRYCPSHRRRCRSALAP